MDQTEFVNQEVARRTASIMRQHNDEVSELQQALKELQNDNMQLVHDLRKLESQPVYFANIVKLNNHPDPSKYVKGDAVVVISTGMGGHIISTGVVDCDVGGLQVDVELTDGTYRAFNIEELRLADKDDGTSAVICVDGKPWEVQGVPNLGLEVGDCVKINENKQILTKGYNDLISGPICNVEAILTDGVEVVDKGEKRFVHNPKGFALEEGDRIIVDPGYFMIQMKLPKDSRQRYKLQETKINWDDIGGLQDAKQQCKEAIEMPFQYKELYAHYNMKKVRGVMLYGPPGCGKTLICRAMASSMGHMHGDDSLDTGYIYVKSPEILCLAPDTPILTSYCGLTSIEKFYYRVSDISKILSKSSAHEVRQLTRPIYTFAINERGKRVKTKIKKVHKLWVPKAYTINLENNGEITASENQPLLTYRDNRTQWVKLNDIQIGEYVAFPHKLTTLNQSCHLSVPQDDNLCIVAHESDGVVVRSYMSEVTTKLPNILNNQVASFLGWFMAEGNVTGEAVTIANTNSIYKQEIIKLFTQFVDVGRITVYKDRVIVYSMALVRFLEMLFEQPLGGKKSHIINCPPCLAKCSQDVISSFLLSAYKGGGSKKEDCIVYPSASKSSVEGVNYLLSLLGVKSKFSYDKKGMYFCHVSGQKEINRLRKLVFGEKNHIHIRSEYNGRYTIPPVAYLLKKIKTDSNLKYGSDIPEGYENVISGRRRIGLYRLRKLVNIFKRHCPQEVQQSKTFLTLLFIATGDFLWTPIVGKITAEPQWMYDVETQYESFIGGNIPLLLHNSKWVGTSEHEIRNLFERGRKHFRDKGYPAILAFDEFDAIAPQRGMRRSSDVADTIVPMFLGEMDGVDEEQTRTNPIVVVMSNRADILDPAITRPGRIDRHIRIGRPDAETASEILKIHTRGMPFEVGVNEEILFAIICQDIFSKSRLLYRINNEYDFTFGDMVSGAVLEAICQGARLNALYRDIEKGSQTGVNLEDFRLAIQKFFQAQQGLNHSYNLQDFLELKGLQPTAEIKRCFGAA